MPRPKSKSKTRNRAQGRHCRLDLDSVQEERRRRRSMSSKPMLFPGAVLLFAFVAGAWQTSAQNLPPTPRTPDLMGIYPGMPASAARVQLQKRSSTVNVISASPADSGFGLNITDPKGPEGTNVN